MKTELPKLWHVVVTKESQKELEIWRGVSLPINKIVGVYNKGGGKGHNPYGKIKGDSYDFGEEITFEEFKVLVLKKQPTEPIYEIY